MKDNVKEPLVGVTVLIVIALYASFVSSRSKIESATGYELTAIFDKIDGLTRGADVSLAGLKVGTIVDDSIDSNYRASVTIRIDDDVRLPTDTSAAIHTDGLFGSKYINLEPGGAEKYILPGGVIKITQGSMVVSDLLDQIIAQGQARAKKFDDQETNGTSSTSNEAIGGE